MHSHTLREGSERWRDGWTVAEAREGKIMNSNRQKGGRKSGKRQRRMMMRERNRWKDERGQKWRRQTDKST